MTFRKRDLVGRVLEFTKTHDLIPPGSKVLVAVSGGADSVVLLHILLKIRPALRCELVVGHVDHGLRPSSASDARFVEGHALALGLEALVRRGDVRTFAKERGLTVEEAAREVRYTLLKEMAQGVKANLIATAHTATDQAETVLMRLIRGTGPLGLVGISKRRDDGLVRPLLCATREEVRAYAEDLGLPFVEDSTNQDPRFLRNRIRLEVLPLLRQLNPRIDFALSSLAEDATDLSGLVESQIAPFFEGPATFEMALNLEDLHRVDRALWPYIILEAFHRITKRPLGLSRSHVEGVLRLINSGQEGEVHLPRGVIVRLASGKVFWFLGKKGRRRPA